MQIVALTGGIASGKSTVADMFADLGVPVVDADVCAREVVMPGSPGLSAVTDAFGTGILDSQGELDRARLRRRVFEDSSARLRLESILHPLIRQCMDTRFESIAARHPAPPYALAAIPLLVETGQQDRFERILVVDVSPEIQLERLMARDGSDIRQARAILDSQAGREQRLACATHVIRNDSDLVQLARRVEQMHEELQVAPPRSTPPEDRDR